MGSARAFPPGGWAAWMGLDMPILPGGWAARMRSVRAFPPPNQRPGNAWRVGSGHSAAHCRMAVGGARGWRSSWVSGFRWRRIARHPGRAAAGRGGLEIRIAHQDKVKVTQQTSFPHSPSGDSAPVPAAPPPVTPSVAAASSAVPPAGDERPPRRILVINDDGIESPGLWAAVRALRRLAPVFVVAPSRQPERRRRLADAARCDRRPPLAAAPGIRRPLR